MDPTARHVWVVQIERAKPDWKRPRVDFKYWIFDSELGAERKADELYEKELEEINYYSAQEDGKVWTKEDLQDGTYHEHCAKRDGYMENQTFGLYVDKVKVLP